MNLAWLPRVLNLRTEHQWPIEDGRNDGRFKIWNGGFAGLLDPCQTHQLRTGFCLATPAAGFFEMVFRVSRLFAALEYSIRAGRGGHLDVSDAIFGQIRNLLVFVGRGDFVSQSHFGNLCVWRMAFVVVHLAQAGHGLQI